MRPGLYAYYMLATYHFCNPLFSFDYIVGIPPLFVRIVNVGKRGRPSLTVGYPQ